MKTTNAVRVNRISAGCRSARPDALAFARFLPMLALVAALGACATNSSQILVPDSRNQGTGNSPSSSQTRPASTTSTTTTIAPRTPYSTTTTLQSPSRPASASASSRSWRLEPVPEAISLSREGIRPDLEVAVRAALAFSGLEGNALRSRSAQIIATARAEAAKYAGIADPEAKADRILASLHENYLRSYSAHQSSLDLAFTTGAFNCVSSAVMYFVFARAAGLEIAGITTVDHAFCVLSLPGKSIDIETTNRYGFDPGSRKEFKDTFGATTGFAYVPPKNYSGRAGISAKRLVSLILSNRVAEYDSQDRHLPSVGLAVDYYAVEKDAESGEFMFSRFRNAAGELSNAGNYATTLEFIDAVHGRYGEEPGLDKVARIAVDNWLGDLGKSAEWSRGVDLILSNRNYTAKSARSADFVKTATHNQVLTLVGSGDFDGARRLIDSRLASGLILASERGTYDGIIGKALFNRSQERSDYASGLADLNAAEVRSTIKPGDIENARIFLVAREAQRLEKTKSSLDAWRFVANAGLSDSAKSRELAAMYRNNAVVEAHNRFAVLYKAKRYAEAKDSIMASLGLFPGEPSLVNDLEILRSVSGPR